MLYRKPSILTAKQPTGGFQWDIRGRGPPPAILTVIFFATSSSLGLPGWVEVKGLCGATNPTQPLSHESLEQTSVVRVDCYETHSEFKQDVL